MKTTKKSKINENALRLMLRKEIVKLLEAEEEQDNKKLKKKQKRVIKIVTGIAIAGVATSLLVR